MRVVGNWKAHLGIPDQRAEDRLCLISLASEQVHCPDRIARARPEPDEVHGAHVVLGSFSVVPAVVWATDIFGPRVDLLLKADRDGKVARLSGTKNICDRHGHSVTTQDFCVLGNPHNGQVDAVTVPETLDSCSNETIHLNKTVASEHLSTQQPIMDDQSVGTPRPVTD